MHTRFWVVCTGAVVSYFSGTASVEGGASVGAVEVAAVGAARALGILVRWAGETTGAEAGAGSAGALLGGANARSGSGFAVEVLGGSAGGVIGARARSGSGFAVEVLVGTAGGVSFGSAIVGQAAGAGVHRNVFCVPGSKNHCAAGIAPIDPGFFVMRAPCHVGGRPAADMHSYMRVNGFLYTQSAVMCTRTKRGGWRGWGPAPATPAAA